MREPRTLRALNAAGASDPGLLRDVNEDRYHVDLSSGIFVVVDGVGGQAAGGKAADIALAALKSGLARGTGTAARRMREAVTVANNEIHRVAAMRPEWHGMACVLTAVVLEEDRAIVGHVGDTRLYKLRDGRIHKVTRDHSPVGEREDQGELSEQAAMTHPRRHEVYRDVGSDRHDASDEEFVDIYRIPFEPDAALLLCSDGLTDLVAAAELRHITVRHAGHPDTVARRLVEAANLAGGKDNVTVVYVEGERFAESAAERSTDRSEITRRRATPASADTGSGTIAANATVADSEQNGKRRTRMAIAGMLTFLGVAAIVASYPYWSPHIRGAVALPPSTSPTIVVQPTESIAAALQRAEPGSQVLVDPGEYRERLVMRSGVVVVSRVPRGATLRLPAGASDTDPAVVAAGVSGASLVGFRVVGDAATPLGTGILISDAHVSVMDVEITGAADVAIDVRARSRFNLTGSAIQDNPGAALVLAAGSSPRIAHNLFAGNGTSDRVAAAIVIDRGVEAQFTGNVFRGLTGAIFAGLPETAREPLLRTNYFVDGPVSRVPSNPPSRGR